MVKKKKTPVALPPVPKGTPQSRGKTATGKKTGRYKSGLESNLALTLEKRVKGLEYESELLRYVLPKYYKPDFVIVTLSDYKYYIEGKGWFRAEDQRKMRAVKESNQHLDIRMFFEKDGKVQGSNMLNSEWCEKYGFPYAIGEIPKSWYR